MRANLSFAVSRRKAGEVALLESLTDLAQRQRLSEMEICQTRTPRCRSSSLVISFLPAARNLLYDNRVAENGTGGIKKTESRRSIFAILRSSVAEKLSASDELSCAKLNLKCLDATLLPLNDQSLPLMSPLTLATLCSLLHSCGKAFPMNQSQKTIAKATRVLVDNSVY
jgi:hypothetical protein